MSDSRPLGTRNLGTLLRDPWLAFNAALMARAHDTEFGDLRLAHSPVLQHVSDDGSRLTEMAERAQLTKSTMNYLVNDLEAMGYVERVPDPADGRAKLVRPTEKGRRAVVEARNVIAEIERDWADLLGREKLDELAALLAELHDRLWPDG